MDNGKVFHNLASKWVTSFLHRLDVNHITLKIRGDQSSVLYTHYKLFMAAYLYLYNDIPY